MTRFFTCITGLFIFASNVCAQSRIYGIRIGSNNHKILSYVNAGSATMHTVLDLSVSQGTVNQSLTNACSIDVFNKRYFFAGNSTLFPGQRLFTVNFDNMSIDVSPSFGTSVVETEDLEYDPFYNRILFHSLNVLKSYDLVTGITSNICPIPIIYNILSGRNRAFDPIKQRYYYIYGNSGQSNNEGRLIDVSTGSLITAQAETGGETMLVFDVETDLHYRMNLNKVVSFNPATGQTAQIATVANIDDYETSQMAMFDPSTHSYMLPFVDYSANNDQIAQVDITAQNQVSVITYTSLGLNQLYYPGSRPLIRKNSEFELMCTYGSSYQWYSNGEPIPGATSQIYTVDDGGDYYAEVQSLQGTIANTDTLIYRYTGIASVKKATQVFISPNPFVSQTIVQVQNGSPVTDIQINDLSGRTIRTVKTHDESTIVLKRENLLAGIYIVSALNNGRILYTQKLVVAPE